MSKALSHILPLFVAVLALIPPLDFIILPPPFELWPMMMAIAGFLGIRTLYIQTNIFIKAIAVLTFINCFFSVGPYISFNQYVSILACCYFYIGLTRMDSWKPMFTVFRSLLVLNLILLILQFFQTDRLLNFGLDRILIYGVIGHYMQMGSFSVILATCLSIITPTFFIFPIIVGLIANSSWTLLCAFVGIVVSTKSRIIRWLAILMFSACVIFYVNSEKIPQFFSKDSGRMIVWEKSISLLNERPYTGWGPGSYKYIFPALSEMNSIPYKTAHNDWIQIAFELGYIFFGLTVISWFWILIRASKNRIFLAGFLVISLNMLVHFPTRMIQCVPLIITFFAYHDKKKGRISSPPSVILR